MTKIQFAVQQRCRDELEKGHNRTTQDLVEDEYNCDNLPHIHKSECGNVGQFQATAASFDSDSDDKVQRFISRLLILHKVLHRGYVWYDHANIVED